VTVGRYEHASPSKGDSSSLPTGRLGDEVAVVRSRGIRRTTAYLRRATAQVAQTSAPWLQRRRSVATVHLTVATGVTGRTFAARDLDAAEAWRAMQWVLPTCHP